MSDPAVGERFTALDIGGAAARLIVAAHRSSLPVIYGPTIDTSIHVVAPPWSGEFDTTLVADDFRVFAAGLASSDLPRTAVLGGGRAAELLLHVERQQGGTSPAVVVTAEVVPSGDDPYPFLRWLVFDVPPDFGSRAAEVINRFLDSLT